MRRAGLYARVSTDEQAEHGVSLEVQEAKLRSVLPSLDAECAGVYVDRGVSGGVPLAKRPAGSQMLQAAKAGQLDLVVAVKLDRMFRSLKDAVATKDELSQWGCGLALLDLNLDTSTDIGDAMYNIAAVFAQLERKRASARVGAINEARREARIYASTLTPFGYQRVQRELNGRMITHFERCPTNGPILERIFTMAASGVTTSAIARALNADGIPSPTGLPTWGPRTIQRILLAPCYHGRLGTMRQVDAGVPLESMPPAANVEALLSPQLARAARSAIRALRSKARRAVGAPSPLSSVLYCAACGCIHYSAGTRVTGDWTTITYRCRTANQGGVCRQPGVSAKRVAKSVLPLVFAALDPERLRDRRQEATAEERERRARLDQIHKQLARIDAAYDHPESSMSADDYVARTGHLRAERDQLLAQDLPSFGLPPGTKARELKALLLAFDRSAWRVITVHMIDRIYILDRKVDRVEWR